ncbi:MAG: hypothetical protein WDZ73_01460 [Candidatus Paceibacterota bacterium]
MAETQQNFWQCSCKNFNVWPRPICRQCKQDKPEEVVVVTYEDISLAEQEDPQVK